MTLINYKSKSRFLFRISFNLVLLVCLLNSTIVAARPDFPPPPKAVVQWVGKDMNINGINSSVRRFHTKKSIEDVVEFYRDEWKRPISKDMPGFNETIDAAPWYIISRIEDGYLLTVQVQVEQDNDSSSWGYLSMSRLPAKNASNDLGEGMPKMANSNVLSQVKSSDAGKDATTMIISNDHSVSSNVTFYRNYYQSKGWTQETDKALDKGQSHALVFKKRRNRVTMMFMAGKNSTKIVINDVTSSLLH